MSITLTTTQSPETLGIEYLDQNGKPMATAPTPDVAPAWTDTTPATETLAVSADGLTAELTPVAEGTDTVNLSVTVAGQVFTAQVDVTVEGQVLTSVAITANGAVVSDPPAAA
jgi:hypothetical protein